MEFNLNEVKNKLKKITPMQWLMLAVGLGIGIFIFKPRQSETMVTALTDENSGNVSGSVGSAGESGGDYSGVINDVIEDTQEGFDSLTSEFNKISTEFANYKSESAKQMQTVESNYQVLANDYSLIQTASAIDVYRGSPGGDANAFNEAFTDINNAVSNKEVSTTAGKTALSVVAGQGNNGAGNSGKDYDSKATDKLYNDISKNASLKTSEIERTKAVIANREKAGQDTTLQKKYLDKINSL